MVDLILKYNKILLILVISTFLSLNVKQANAVENANDPFESVNRNIFKFNNNLDDYFFKYGIRINSCFRPFLTRIPLQFVLINLLIKFVSIDLFFLP